MTHRPNPPGSFVEPEFDVVASNKRAGTNVPRVVPASKSKTGGIEHDERGHARWKWNADLAASTDPAAETFNYLKALDADLQIDRRRKVRAREQSMTKPGINPYDTARAKPK